MADFFIFLFFCDNDISLLLISNNPGIDLLVGYVKCVVLFDDPSLKICSPLVSHTDQSKRCYFLGNRFKG